MKKALLIAFHFPPFKISSGIQRTLSMARYLEENDWQPTILTISPKAYEITSDDQLKGIPPGVKVIRAFGRDTARHFSVKGSYPSFMALPDRWVSWLPGAVVSGLSFIRKEKPDLIWSTFPIATAHLIGWVLSKLTGVPWIADCRDSMTEDYYPTDPVRRRAFRWVERRAVQDAALLVFTTSGTQSMYCARYPSVEAEKFAVIPNGYDEGIFVQAEKNLIPYNAKNSGRVTLIHSGILYPSERDPTQFFDALSELKSTNKISAEELAIVLRSTANDDIYRPMLESRGIADIVSLEPGINYQEALSEMLLADGLLLFQAANCNHQIPAKLYEYFRAHKPVLALTASEGDTAQVLREADIDTVSELSDKEGIKEKLVDFIRAVRGGTAPIANPDSVQRYSRRSLTGEYARLFEKVVS